MKTIDKSKYNETFIAEANEQLTEMNTILLGLEKDPNNLDTINDFFRLIHTLKGSSAILGHSHIAELSHVMEDILDEQRNNEKPLTQEIIDILFESLDTVEKMVGEVTNENKTTEGKGILNKLREIVKTGSEDIQKSPNSLNGLLTIEEMISELDDDNKIDIETALSQKSNVILASIIFDKKCKFIEGRSFQIFRDLEEEKCLIIRTFPEKDKIGELEDNKTIHLIIGTEKNSDKVRLIIETTQDINEVIIDKITNESLSNTIVGKSGKNIRLGISDTIRVKVHLLDSLLNLVGENMINNIQINQIAQEFRHSGLNTALKKSTMLTEELQHYVLQMRMVPIDQIFRRFPRMVRDMAKDEGKEIDLIIEGGEIEIDRSLLDEIGDSLVHLLRNAVDHGIETNQSRKQDAKNKTGSIILTAHGEQGHIVIEVSDDGAGIDTVKLTKKAVQKGIISEEEGEKMNEDERRSLIFLPGISTAEKVTEVSGRGVGLDVVFNKIKSLGGIVSINSTLKKGTKVTIRLPPTMAIVKALLIRIADERYAIPLENVAETVKVSPDSIHTVKGTGMFKLRDEIIPLFDLNNVFIDVYTQTNENLSAVIVEKDNKRVGLIVDEFLEQQEIVVKTIGESLRDSEYFSGATILGDGSVAMIINVGAFV